jgi:hypothetical protein
MSWERQLKWLLVKCERSQSECFRSFIRTVLGQRLYVMLQLCRALTHSRLWQLRVGTFAFAKLAVHPEHATHDAVLSHVQRQLRVSDVSSTACGCAHAFKSSYRDTAYSCPKVLCVALLMLRFRMVAIICSSVPCFSHMCIEVNHTGSCNAVRFYLTTTVFRRR